MDGGAGILGLDFGLEDRADEINFVIQTGIGGHFFVSERTALSAEWRYQHISNARINRPNRSLNTAVFSIGASLFFR